MSPSVKHTRPAAPARALSKKLVVPNELGLHARPASLLVRLTQQFRSEITIRKGSEEVNGKSVIEVLMLASEKGQELTFTARGDDAAEALAAIEELFRANLAE